ncbi:pyrroline-5-carboxylate reductase [Kushneria phosphatilytica]|uniref:Pyrroline-5-carboxylate reductase n=1 Tax=Kushneria phosphatilytica TaxID=657387 RepID=A0A1S1NR10_9GAMM|nr:pyrroline-5-carboxylate reductase [Kushneria phosphatilytica]OHV11254.1 pyrroline-5-carboxylate reductase [Kushneria phosphatilytica]QEL12171.1 pyrroline-5-carboxylate reductase [Kushneria phosphatilytica]
MASQITFIGAGNMARAIFGGLIESGYPADAITATARHQQTLDTLAARYGINVTTDNAGAVADADVVILAVKPQLMRNVCQSLGEALAIGRPLIISVAAGITVDTLADWLDDPTLPIVRCMPNTPSLVGTGASGLFAGQQVSAEQRELAESLMRAVGIVEWVEEETLLSAVTAIAGSAPAYFFYMIEALEKAGVARGLSPDSSRRLAIQTALGAARMADQSEYDPETLKQQVMSPKGTTERAIHCFEQAGLERIVDDATRACFDRAEELARELQQR